MEYLLPAAFAIGLLLFVLSWLRVVIAGFGHHFVTGLVSVVPVLNLLILPGIWHKVYAWVLAGILGLLVAVGSWYGGADKYVYRYAHDAGLATPGMDMPADTPALSTQTLNPTPIETPAAPLPSGAELPKNALYRMTYQQVDSATLGQYAGRYVRITRNDRKTFEGRVLGSNEEGVLLERRANGGVIEHHVDYAEIEKAEVMSKQ
ncbi:MAG: hypothetical protein R3E95_07950 [Thiolinea sp.]